MNVFFKLEKIDPASGIFSAICASERVDKDREQLDYRRSKPLFQAAESEMFKASGGKNYFPINLQHKQDAPVGRVIEPLAFDDVNKTIRCTGKLEDLNARNLMATGVLTGVSIEGIYEDKTHLPNGVTKYVAKPIRIAVCDVPCNPDCTFDLVKSDGSVMQKHFVPSLTTPSLLSIFDTPFQAANRRFEFEKFRRAGGFAKKSSTMSCLS